MNRRATLLLCLPVLAATAPGCLAVDDLVLGLATAKTDAYVLDPALIPAEDREEIALVTADGLTLGAAWVVAPAPRGRTVVYCHGVGDNIDDVWRRVAALHELGFDVLVFDYRGFGKSEGEADEAGMYLDGEAAWAFVTEARGVPPDQIVAYGHSLGGGVATEVAARHRLGGLVLESSFASFDDQVDWSTHLDLPRTFLSQAAFDNVGKLAQMPAFPKAILHGTEDRTWPVANAHALYDAATAPRSLAFFDGAGHQDVPFRDPARYREALLAGLLLPAE